MSLFIAMDNSQKKLMLKINHNFVVFLNINTQANIVQDKIARCTLVSDSGKLGGSCPPMPALLYTV